MTLLNISINGISNSSNISVGGIVGLFIGNNHYDVKFGIENSSFILNTTMSYIGAIIGNFIRVNVNAFYITCMNFSIIYLGNSGLSCIL